MQCNAIIDYQPDGWGFIPVRCGQVVAVRTYPTTLGFVVSYCPQKGHQESVRRRYAELKPYYPAPEPPMPRFLHEDPEYMDGATMAKAAAER